MGADWVCLFNKRLCDEIRALTPSSMTDFIQARLKQLNWSSELRCGFEDDVPATTRLTELRGRGRTGDELKADLVVSLCVSRETIVIDYWGCYAEVFRGGDPPGSIPDYELFPHIKEQSYLLLRPEHLDQMLKSLGEHKSEMRVMTAQSVAQLRSWRDDCIRDSGWMAAYFLDY